MFFSTEIRDYNFLLNKIIAESEKEEKRYYKMSEET